MTPAPDGTTDQSGANPEREVVFLVPPARGNGAPNRRRLAFAAGLLALLGAGAGLSFVIGRTGTSDTATGEVETPTTSPSTTIADAREPDGGGAGQSPRNEPSDDGRLPLTPTRETPGSWSGPVELRTISVTSVWPAPEVVAGTSRVLLLEPTGTMVEGCEGGAIPESRLASMDLDSGARSVLAERWNLWRACGRTGRPGCGGGRV